MTGAAATGAIGSGVGGRRFGHRSRDRGGRGGRGGRSHAGGCSSWHGAGVRRCVFVAVVLRDAVVDVDLVVTGLAAVVVSAAGRADRPRPAPESASTTGVAVGSAGTSALCANKGAEDKGNDGGERGHRGANCFSVGHGVVNPWPNHYGPANSTNRTPTGMDQKCRISRIFRGFPASFRRLAAISPPIS